jgi:hypothetical protein
VTFIQDLIAGRKDADSQNVAAHSSYLLQMIETTFVELMVRHQYSDAIRDPLVEPLKVTFFLKLAALMAVAVFTTRYLSAQDLAPRAYVITPLHLSAATVTWGYYDGSIDYNGALPVSGATGTYQVPIFTYYHSFSLFGRSANILASLPYGVGSFQGTVAGAGQKLYRSGLLDSVYRLSVNLKGGPAVSLREFPKWRQKLLLGASLKIIALTGQYDPTKLINGYAGIWFFTTNSSFWSRNVYFSGTRSQSQDPIGAFEGT